MLTPEQMEKAQEALKDLKSRKLIQQIKLHLYLNDIEKAARWRLPFRMVHDRQFLPDEEPPNDYFSRPAPVIYDKTKQCIVTNPAAVPPISGEEALFYFTRHLAAVDLTEYKRGDWTGRPISEEEAERLKAMYQERQRDYVLNPGRYDTQIHPAQTKNIFDIEERI